MKNEEWLIHVCTICLLLINFVRKLVIGNCPTERRNPETNGGGPKAKENTTGKVGEFALPIYSESKNDKIKLLSLQTESS